MSSLPQLLAELGGLDPAAIPELEYEIAWAQRSTAYTARGQIPWSRHFPWLRNRLSEAQNHRCCWCRKPMDEAGPLEDRPTFEHLVPLSEGGEDTPANLAIACFRCNNRRGNRDLPT
jgi:5-methylcytosine-specific restriction endonuclease McrA